MKIIKLLIALMLLVSPAFAEEAVYKIKIMVVDSYQRDYVWSNSAHEGLTAGLLEYKYLDNEAQFIDFDKNDQVETTRAIIRREWMNSKKKKSDLELAESTLAISEKILEFDPDILILGDDNAARYIGNQFLDTALPIVFWGVNNTPVKYGLVDKIGRPGHNVTGVYQSGYYIEGMKLLKKLVPTIKTFAILSDATITGRSHRKKVEYYANKGLFPVELIGTIATNDYEEFKDKAVKMSKEVDAFFVVQYSGLIDKRGESISTKEVSEWYQANISIPEVAVIAEFVEEGLLCAADDSGYNQGLMAVRMVNDILKGTIRPKDYPAQTPKRGPLVVNRVRAAKLNININDDLGIEKIVGGINL